MVNSKRLYDTTALGGKRALLLQLLEDRARAESVLQEEPLSQGQKALWYLDALVPTTSVHNIALFMPLTAETSAVTVRQALYDVVAHHPMLRSTFAVHEGEPVRIVHSADLVSFEAEEARGWSLHETKERMAEAFGQPFDLNKGPVARAHLFENTGGFHIFLLVAHHIVSDAVSMSILEDELRRRIAAHEQGRSLPLEATISFSDYVRWHEALLAGPEGERLWTYWKEQFPDGLPSVALPVNYPVRPDRTLRKQTRGFHLDSALAEAVHTFARDEGTTPFVVLLSAFAIVLRRHATQDVVGIGTAAMGRSKPEFKQTVGYFANALLLKLDLSGDPSFKSLIRRVQRTVVGALEHQDFPLPLLVERLQKEQGRRLPSVFQVMFMHQHLHSLTLAAGVPLKDRVQVDVDETVWEFVQATLHPGGDSELLLYTCTMGDALLGSFIYDADLFNASAIEGWLEELEAVLREAMREPDASITAPYYLPVEESLIPDEGLPYPRDRTVHDLFAEQAARTPEAIAIVQGERNVTYEMLNRWADRVAQRLMEHGLQPGDRVALVCERSAEAMAGMVGTLKAGCAFIPIDVQQPPRRMQALIQQAQAGAVLYTNSWEASWGDPIPAVQLETLMPAPDDAAGVSLPEVGAESPAYVMYTSGSTGTPKGVVIPHRAIVRLVMGTDYVSLTDADVVAHVSNIAFDATTFEIWGALLHGGRVAILPNEVLLSPPRFATALREQQISILFLTTALFNVMASAVPGAFSTLRYVLFGGEAVNPDAVRRVLESDPPQALLHVYGPTENTTFTTWHHVTEVPEGAGTVPIGRALAHTQVYVLNQDGQLVRPGATGELYIGGDGLALGYLDSPDLTNLAFVERRIGAAAPRRLYKTGDLVRLQEDGTLVFVGRADRQVKIRGFRIELDEIECVLRQHPNVDACVVDTWHPADGEMQLVAYVAFQPGCDPTPDTVRGFLSEHLPPYMIPYYIDVLTHLPLNANGKVDRAALPKPTQKSAPAEEKFAGPSDPFELHLTKLWEDVIGVKPIGKRDNFFDLGGHSLMAARLVARIEAELGQRIPISAFITAPTIQALAETLHTHAERPRWPAVVPIRASGSKCPLFCVPGAAGHAIQFYQLSRHLADDRPVYGFELREPYYDQRPLVHTQEMAAYFVNVLRAIQPQGPYMLAGFSSGGTIAFEMAQQLHQQGEDIRLLALLDTLHPNVLHTLNHHVHQEKLHAEQASHRSISLLGSSVVKVRYILRHARRTLKYYAIRSLKRPVPTPLFRAMQARAASRYQPAPYTGHLVILRTKWSRWGALVPADLGWGEVAQGSLEIHHIPGVHIEVLNNEHNVQHLARVLGPIMERTQEGHEQV